MDRTPTPRIRNNLPPPEDRDDSGGHEIPSPPMQWYERANPRSSGGGSFKPGPWERLPEPGGGGLTREDLNALHRRNPDYYPEYKMGGAINTDPYGLPTYAEGGSNKDLPRPDPQPNYDRWASDPERWSVVGRQGYDPEEPPTTTKFPPIGKRRVAIPKFAGGGFVGKLVSGFNSTSGGDLPLKGKAKEPDKDAGVPGSDAAAVDAAVRYGAAPTAPEAPTAIDTLGTPGMTYADGGVVSYADGGQTQGSSVPNSQSGGITGWDPTNYITAASDWANTQNQRGDQTYQWATDQFNKNSGVSDRVTNSALQQGDVWGDAAAAGLSRYESMYPDAMKEQLDFARQYASPENLALYRGQAMAGVGQAFDAQAKAAADSLQSYGLKPQDVASRLDATVRTQRAAAQAGAGTASDVNSKLIGQQLLGTAIQTGQAGAQLAGQQAGVSQQARNQAVNTGLATTASGSATMGTPTQWAQLANTELKEWPKARLDQQASENQTAASWNDINKTNLQAQKQQEDQSGGAGALIGAGLGALTKMAPMMMMSGGSIPKFDDGGAVDGVTGGVTPPMQAIQTGSVVPESAEIPNIPGDDKVPALVGKGEGVLPRDVMDWIGEKGFQAMIQKVRMERQKGTHVQGQPADPQAQQMAEQAGPQFMTDGAPA